MARYRINECKMGRDRWLRTVAAFVIACVMLGPVRAPAEPHIDLINAPIWADINTGVALSGYDVISFFMEDGPVHGRAEFEAVWGGVAWWFDSHGNMEAFLSAPEVYAPRFGGHGTVALSRGAVLPGQPDVWEIWEGQLYLFHSPVNRTIWRSDRLRITQDAVTVWKTQRRSQEPIDRITN